MELIREEFKGSGFYFTENKKLIFGYTETDTTIEIIEEFFNIRKTVQLDQVHGNKIYFSDAITDYPDGDGIILNETGVLAVIRTADCVPLFFWEDSGRYAGVIHIGWRGLYSKIEINLLKILKGTGIAVENISFYTGPAIEGKCYTVQQDLVEKFSDFAFKENIFKNTKEGYAMDVIRGIELSLIKEGVPKQNIKHSGICTFCNKNFPSYRRGDREKRIFNFLIRK